VTIEKSGGNLLVSYKKGTKTMNEPSVTVLLFVRVYPEIAV